MLSAASTVRQSGSPENVHSVLALSPMVVFVIAAFAAGRGMPHWAAMWLLAMAVFFGCKWLTYATSPSELRTRAGWRSLAYLALWPGMNAAEFLDPGRVPARPSASAWLIAGGKTVFGAAMIWGLVPVLSGIEPLLLGWVGMIGVVFVLHFGTFHLLALAWQRVGVTARPIMQMPVAARSLAEFWGARWNRAYHELAVRYVHRPLRRRYPIAIATMLTFVISGLIHELVITVPARGNYGLPMLFFLAQGAGVVVQRSALGNRLGLSNGWQGRLWMAFVVVAPAPLLFPPLFVDRVVTPFLGAIGALP